MNLADSGIRSPACLRRNGFTLIELSIVLVIIGLIAGGVMVGQDLIEAAKLRSIVTEKEQYVTAINTFRMKYDSLPGDMPNATQFWGTDPTGCPDGNTSQTPAATTCNGNGDGKIGPGNNQPYELFRFWQHLANAGIISGQFSGHRNHIYWVPTNTAGTAIPFAKFGGGAAWWFENPQVFRQRSAFTPRIFFGPLLEIGRNNSQRTHLDPVLSPTKAFSIDSKIDDGFPSSGFVVHDWSVVHHAGVNAQAPGPCISTTGPPHYVDYYDAKLNGDRCMLNFILN